MSMLLSAPFVQFALRFADLYAVPLISALCAASSAQIASQIFFITDEPYPLRTILMAVSFIVGFKVAQSI